MIQDREGPGSGRTSSPAGKTERGDQTDQTEMEDLADQTERRGPAGQEEAGSPARQTEPACLAVRRAEERDVPEILRLLVQVNMVHHTIRPDLFKGPATKYTEAELADLIAREDDPIFILPAGEGRIAGYIFCRAETVEESNLRTGIRTLYIDDLCVDEACRHMGVGEKLYRYALSYARDRGFYNVTLHVWGGNDGADRFYEKMGMKPQFTCLEMIL